MSGHIADDKTPDTVVIVGAGASVGLGVPTMFNFMDRTMEHLKELKNKNSEGADSSIPEAAGKSLSDMQEFMQKIRAASSYVNMNYLNIEELYGLAEMAKVFLDSSAKNYKDAFNRAIYLMTIRAGEEFIAQKDTYGNIYKQISTIKHESHTQDPDLIGFTDHNRNLLAYLSLASFQDASGKHPLFVQFNWDLALDRAILVSRFAEPIIKKGNATVVSREDEVVQRGRYRDMLAQESNSEVVQKFSDVDFKWIHHAERNVNSFCEYPLVIRPHGGIHWCANTKESTDDTFTFVDSKSVQRWPAVESKDKMGKAVDPIHIIGNLIWDMRLWPGVAGEKYLGGYMSVEPPTWQKNINAFTSQWSDIQRYMKSARRLIFLGYSLPKTDLYFRHFLSLALSENNHAPKVYVWNPEIMEPSEVRDNYMSLFGPLARVGRLLGIGGRFGDPAYFDVNRAMYLAKPLEP